MQVRNSAGKTPIIIAQEECQYPPGHAACVELLQAASDEAAEANMAAFLAEEAAGKEARSTALSGGTAEVAWLWRGWYVHGKERRGIEGATARALGGERPLEGERLQVCRVS